MRSSNKGFTLVELIVVITILAILATVAFLSVQSYTGFARNAVRLDGASKITTLIKTGITSGKSVLAYVVSGDEVPGASVGGTGAAVGVNYQAGIPNYTALGLNEEDLLDPLTSDHYRVGVITKLGGKHEVIMSLESGGAFKANIKGNWSPRIAESLPGAGGTGQDRFTLSDFGDLSKFTRGDIVSFDSGDSGIEITSISDDGLTLLLSADLTGPATTVSLGANEVTGLVVAQDGVSPILNGSSVTLAYGGG